MRHFIIIVMAVVFMLSCTAKVRMKQFYYEYIDPPPQINMRATHVSAKAIAFSEAIRPVNEKLSELTIFLEVNDKISYEEWLQNIVSQFPWIQGVAVIGKQGGIFYSQPEGLFKQVNFDPLIDVKVTGLSLQQKAMFLPVDNKDAFLFLAQPIFSVDEIIEYRVVAVAMSSLAQFSKEASKLYFIGGADWNILWKGEETQNREFVDSINWKKKENSRVAGKIKKKKQEIRYITRYLGPVPFIFVMDSV
ncbi:MAG: hypothetical protein ACRCV3_02465 [Desulfovibrionaceae bacterium]